MENFPEKHPLIALVVTLGAVQLVVSVGLTILLSSFGVSKAAAATIIELSLVLACGSLGVRILTRAISAELKQNPRRTLRIAFYGFLICNFLIGALIYFLRLIF